LQKLLEDGRNRHSEVTSFKTRKVTNNPAIKTKAPGANQPPENQISPKEQSEPVPEALDEADEELMASGKGEMEEGPSEPKKKSKKLSKININESQRPESKREEGNSTHSRPKGVTFELPEPGQDAGPGGQGGEMANKPKKTRLMFRNQESLEASQTGEVRRPSLAKKNLAPKIVRGV
jgi:hypothetical protein